MEIQRQVAVGRHHNDVDDCAGSVSSSVGPPTCAVPVADFGKHRARSANFVSVSARSVSLGRRRHEAVGARSSRRRARRPRCRKIRYDSSSVKAAFHDTDTDILARMSVSVSMSVSWNAALSGPVLDRKRKYLFQFLMSSM